ncbi:VIT and VWA domain-containing protein [Variovorax sp. J22P168]|uniref:VIT and vWA domain-containing protein n=1 Tax=Variovorax jilinensis TaxID=3053513 RepID=UPI0025771151|nr:VIT and VWA domain-containing protein [Variovorax sp. J22P168]MDM0014252.1 VIT and VWA domain-containing protein [Variovorax sp. J22P168]
MDAPATSQTDRRSGRWLWLATLAIAGASFVALSLQPLHAQEAPAPRSRTESPYFFVKSDDPTLDRLPLKGTEVDVRVSGVIADVTVTQTYRNEGQRAIEARYVFPGSTRAAVGALDVRLGDRLITAQIREKAQARIDYDAARKEGRTAALLEQHLSNVFQMNVANILPGDEVKVRLRYTELLVPQGGNYQFVFPTVVGPRYNSPQSENARARWVAQPTLRAGVEAGTAFRLKVALDTPMALHEVRSATHAIEVSRREAAGGDGANHADVSLARSAAPADNRDFVLDWRLAGERIQSGLMLYQGQGNDAENFFLAMVEPPKAVAANAIAPRDYIFVVDISGSMHGFPLDTAKAMLERLIGGLRPSDTFNVLLFSGSNRMLSPHSVPATRANITQALATIQNYGGGGSTELIPALKRAYAEPKAEGVSRTLVVVTDGYVTVEREAFELVRRNLDRANLFAFGIGSSVNRHLMEGLARAGMGEPFVITDPIQAPEQAARFKRMVESPVLTQVKARFEGLDVYDVEPQALPDLLGERPLILFGKWRGEARGRLVIEGRSAEGPYRQELRIDPAARRDAAALRSLWARHRIASLSDQESLEGGDALRQRITDLGLRHGLLTQYTSFIAVDQVVRNTAPQNATGVDQPLPLPQGVGESALGQSLGAEVPSTPEPELMGAVAVVLGMLAMLRRRARRRDARRLTS